jgi:hypothetical protein
MLGTLKAINAALGHNRVIVLLLSSGPSPFLRSRKGSKAGRVRESIHNCPKFVNLLISQVQAEAMNGDRLVG